MGMPREEAEYVWTGRPGGGITFMHVHIFLTYIHNLRLIPFSCSGAKLPDTALLKFLRAPPNPARVLLACP